MEEIVAPDFGESVFEASVGQWFKSTGEYIEIGEPIVELHTDKAVQEINAVQSGTIGTLFKKLDDVVRPGDALCEFQPTDSNTSEKPSKEPDDVVDNEEIEIAQLNTIDESGIDEAPDVATGSDEDEGYVEIQFSTFAEIPSAPIPANREVDTEHQDSNATIIDDSPIETAPSATQSEMPSEISELSQIVVDKPVRRERLSRRRLTTARRMSQVQAEAVMTTTYNEVDMYEVIRIRRDFGPQFLETNSVKLGFMSFFVKAVLNGLTAFPILNSELDENELVYKEYYDIGVAVASPHGLVVPVIRNADKKSFAEIESEIRVFSEKASTGSFALEDLVGGTFTITNGGVFGSMMSTPILNPPQVGILGMHNIVDRAVVVGEQITIRPMMYLAVTYDHRVVEGAQAVQFLMRIKESLESAELLMLAN